MNSKQDKKKISKIKCKYGHAGQFRSAGVVPISARDGIVIMTILYCKECGIVVGKDMKLTGIAIPPACIPVDLSKIVKG